MVKSENGIASIVSGAFLTSRGGLDQISSSMPHILMLISFLVTMEYHVFRGQGKRSVVSFADPCSDFGLGVRLAELLGQQLWDMYFFDNLVCNIDRNPGKILVTSDYQLWMMHHTRAFQSLTERLGDV